MGDINRQIVTTFSARGGSQVRAVMGQIEGGLNGILRQQTATGRSTGYLNDQLRAMGTTMRYALAGTVIFGSASLVTRLSQIQQQLGLISAISPTAFDGVALAGHKLTAFGEQAEDAAFRALTPIAEFNDGLINLVSTVQNVPQNEVVPILQQIAQTAQLSLTPVDEATKGITGLMVAFGEPVNLKNAQRYLAEYQRMIFSVPGGASAGPQIIQQLPQLSAVSRLAAVNPEQMFGLMTTVLRAGGSPATGARGLQYLIQGLAQPPSDESRKALAGIGITPGAVQERGGVEALFRLIQEVKKRGFTGDIASIRGLSPETLDQLEGVTGQGQLAGLGITGKGAEFARTAVGRIHGVRSLILLAAQNDKALKDLQDMAELGRDHNAQLEELSGAWRRFHNRAKLREASISIDQMAVDIAQAFEPVLNLMAPALSGLRGVVDDHSNSVAYGAAAAATAYTVARRVRGGRRVGVIRGVGAVGTAQDAVSGSVERGHTPQNPLYVAVVYSMGGPGGNSPPVILDKDGKPMGGGKGGRGGKWGALAGLAKMNPLHPLALPFLAAGDSYQGERDTKFPLLRQAMANRKNLNAAQARVIEAGQKKYISPQTAEARLLAISEGRFDARRNRIMVEGVAKMNLNLNLKRPDGTTTRKRVSVSADLVPRFKNGSRPQSKGKDRTYRGGD